MSKEYFMPRFNHFKPRKLGGVINKIKKSRYYDEDLQINAIPPEDKFEMAYKKFKNKEYLYSRDIKVLTYYLNIIVEEGAFKKYSCLFKSRFETLTGYRGFLRPMLAYIYNSDENKKYTENVYEFLKRICIKIKGSKKYKDINEYVCSCNEYQSYLNKIKININKSKNIEEIENIYKKCFIKTTDLFYIECMAEYIINNYMDEQLFDEYKKIINLANQHIKQTILAKILSKYIEVTDIENYPDRWFRLIGEVLGDPYSRANMKWGSINDECKEVYRRWNNNKNIYEFFLNEVKGGDRDRLTFWRRYVDCIYRIKYYSSAGSALIMEFDRYAFVEFAQHGNAMYIYDKNVFNIDYLEQYSRNNLYREFRAKDLKDVNLTIKKMNHKQGWQIMFESELNRLGYKPGRW